MYRFAKYFFKAILPEGFLIKNEIFFRKLLIPLYSGTLYQCNICNTKLKSFASVKNQQDLCPVCGSLPRTRRLYQFLQTGYLQSGYNVLDFSPSRSIYRNLKKLKSINYYSTDFEKEFLADFKFDITAIDIEDEFFNLVICYHVLEHIEDDGKAMAELYRVLKRDGILLVQTPFKEGLTYEDSTITSPEKRLLHFGQEDHVRIYSAKDLSERLKSKGFMTEIIEFEKNDYYKLSAGEKIILCRK